MLNNFKIGTKIGASFTLGLTVLATLGVVSYTATNQLLENSYWQNHTYTVLEKLNDLISELKDAETGQRGYLLTGEKRYLDPYNTAMPVIETDVKELRKLTIDNPNQQRRIDILEPRISQRLAVIKDVISLRDNKDLKQQSNWC